MCVSICSNYVLIDCRALAMTILEDGEAAAGDAGGANATNSTSDEVNSQPASDTSSSAALCMQTVRKLRCLCRIYTTLLGAL
jgi:hypothetical protein